MPPSTSATDPTDSHRRHTASPVAEHHDETFAVLAGSSRPCPPAQGYQDDP